MSSRRAISRVSAGNSHSNQSTPGRVESSSRSVCQVCGCSMSLKQSGEFSVHGPGSNRCGGSGMLPFLQPSHSSRSHSPPSQSSQPSQPLRSSPVHQRPALFDHRLSVRVLKRIPRASRHLVATKLAHILDDVGIRRRLGLASSSFSLTAWLNPNKVVSDVA